ncbi:MAG TPA: hypothetical protein VK657_04445 [Terriglobales bacterium]|nr:hypothetical protein [Terriglobales bacterium]
MSIRSPGPSSTGAPVMRVVSGDEPAGPLGPGTLAVGALVAGAAGIWTGVPAGSWEAFWDPGQFGACLLSDDEAVRLLAVEGE